ncbi:hypothetical protein [Rhodococcus sp. 1R11]|uniref:hypothetical protein n=1 Tax=Rhodococcus sp. 1R11 TaxID=2559614 RepID=UPI0014300B83|nr:hypothetical protein [Rhodococcus sp. 1R11]
MVSRLSPFELFVDECALVVGEIANAGEQGRKVDPQFLGRLVVDAVPIPCDDVDQAVEIDQSLGGNAVDLLFLAQCESEIRGVSLWFLSSSVSCGRLVKGLVLEHGRTSL